MKQHGSRIVRFRPETWACARALYLAPPEAAVKPDDVIGHALELAERRREGAGDGGADREQELEQGE